MQVGQNKVVSIDYTLTDAAGAIIDSSKGNPPLPYLHGAGNIVPGLEAGPSPWIEVGQERIDAFARTTGDHQSIHIDPALAAAGP